MTENEIWEKIRDSIHLTDMQIIKILIRFAMWHNYFYYTSPTDIAYFFDKYIKTGDVFEQMCHRILYFNLCIPGFINFCNFLNIPYPKQHKLWEHENEFTKLEKDVNVIASQMETHFFENDIPITYRAIFDYIINQN